MHVQGPNVVEITCRVLAIRAAMLSMLSPAGHDVVEEPMSCKQVIVVCAALTDLKYS